MAPVLVGAVRVGPEIRLRIGIYQASCVHQHPAPHTPRGGHPANQRPSSGHGRVMRPVSTATRPPVVIIGLVGHVGRDTLLFASPAPSAPHGNRPGVADRPRRLRRALPGPSRRPASPTRSISRCPSRSPRAGSGVARTCQGGDVRHLRRPGAEPSSRPARQLAEVHRPDRIPGMGASATALPPRPRRAGRRPQWPRCARPRRAS